MERVEEEPYPYGLVLWQILLLIVGVTGHFLLPLQEYDIYGAVYVFLYRLEALLLLDITWLTYWMESHWCLQLISLSVQTNVKIHLALYFFGYAPYGLVAQSLAVKLGGPEQGSFRAYLHRHATTGGSLYGRLAIIGWDIGYVLWINVRK